MHINLLIKLLIISSKCEFDYSVMKYVFSHFILHVLVCMRVCVCANRYLYWIVVSLFEPINHLYSFNLIAPAQNTKHTSKSRIPSHSFSKLYTMPLLLICIVNEKKYNGKEIEREIETEKYVKSITLLNIMISNYIQKISISTVIK